MIKLSDMISILKDTFYLPIMYQLAYISRTQILVMDSDDDYLYDATDSGNESPEGGESEGEQVLIFR